MAVLRSARNYLDTLVHPAARRDVLMAARHRAFIASRLLGGCGALAAIPVYLVVRGIPGALEVAVLGWLVGQILLVFFLTRTGRYDAANLLSALAFTALITFVAWRSGGINSSAAVWLVLVPIEAALFASRRVAILAGLAALAAAMLLGFSADGHFMENDFDRGMLAAASLTSAALFGTGLAIVAQLLARGRAPFMDSEEAQYSLLACSMSDVITRHGRNGAVLFISPGAEALFGARPEELLGHGVFDRVHIGDRPAYLSALADAARGDARSLEFRIRNGSSFAWVDMRCHPLDQGLGGAQQRDVVAVLRNINERKALTPSNREQRQSVAPILLTSNKTPAPRIADEQQARKRA